MFERHRKKLEAEGHEVRIPAFDDHPDLDALGVCRYNREAIAWADRVDVIWDARSIGFIFDFGMVFALHKAVYLVYVEEKTFRDVVLNYAKTLEGLYPWDIQKRELSVSEYIHMLATMENTVKPGPQRIRVQGDPDGSTKVRTPDGIEAVPTSGYSPTVYGEKHYYVEGKEWPASKLVVIEEVPYE